MAFTVNIPTIINNPYKITPSKKGSFPKGVFIGQDGSRINEVCRKTPPRSTAQLVNTKKISSIDRVSLYKKDQASFLRKFQFSVQGANCPRGCYV